MRTPIPLSSARLLRRMRYSRRYCLRQATNLRTWARWPYSTAGPWVGRDRTPADHIGWTVWPAVAARRIDLFDND